MQKEWSDLFRVKFTMLIRKPLPIKFSLGELPPWQSGRLACKSLFSVIGLRSLGQQTPWIIALHSCMYFRVFLRATVDQDYPPDHAWAMAASEFLDADTRDWCWFHTEGPGHEHHRRSDQSEQQGEHKHGPTISQRGRASVWHLIWCGSGRRNQVSLWAELSGSALPFESLLW